MKRIVIVLLIFSSYILQAQQEDNPFHESEKIATEQPNENLKKGGDITARGIGNPPKPVPIDEYIPLLITTALGVIVYRAYPRKKGSVVKY